MKKRTKRKLLHSLEPREVSLVDTGANLKKFLIHKHGAEPMDNAYEDLARLMEKTPESILQAIDDAVVAVVQKRKDIGGGGALDAQPELSERAQAAIKAVARILAPVKDELTDADLDQLQAAIGMAEGIDEQMEHEGEPEKVALSEDQKAPDKAPDAAVSKDEEPVLMMDCPAGVPLEKHTEAMQAAKDAYAKHLEKADSEEPMNADNILKNLDTFPQAQREQVHALFQTALKEQRALIQKSKMLEAELAKERDRRLEQEYLARAEELAPSMAEDNLREVATILKTLHSADQAAATQLERILKTSHDQYEEVAKLGGLFTEHGSRLSNGGATTAEAKLEAMVDSIVQKSSGDKTREQIYTQVIRTPEGRKLRREIDHNR